MQPQLQKLASVDGVLAVALVRGNTTSTELSSKTNVIKDRWQAIFTSIADVLNKTKDLRTEEALRVVVGDYTITAERFGDGVVVIATVLGHPVAKSLRRMLSRAMKAAERSAPSTSAQPNAMTA